MAGERENVYAVPDFVRETTRTVVVNMFGGPGSGKTTAAHEFIAELKKRGYVAEYAPEFAKELVWTLGDREADPSIRALAEKLLDGSFSSQKQLYSEQKARITRLAGQCDFVVTDSPIALSAIYLKPAVDAEQQSMDQMVLADMADFDNFNVFVKRGGAYEAAGRIHDADEAREIDRQLRSFLKDNSIRYGSYDHDHISSAIDNAVKVFEAVNKGKPGSEERASERRARAQEARPARERGPKEAGEGPEFVHITLPKKGYRGAELLKDVEGAKDGTKTYKLPPHMVRVETAGGRADLSGYSTVVYGWQVKEWDNDPGYYDISFPKENAKGQPWEVNFRKWVKSGGEWEEARATVAASALVEPAQTYRESRRQYARSMAQAEEDRGPKAKGAQAPDGAEERAIGQPGHSGGGKAEKAAPAPEPKAAEPERPAKREATRPIVPEVSPPAVAMPTVRRDAVMATESARAQAGAVAMRTQTQAR